MLAAVLTLLIVLVIALVVLLVAWLGTGVRHTVLPVPVETWGRRAAAVVNGGLEPGRPARAGVSVS